MPGVPKEPEPQSEDDINLTYKQKPKPQEDVETVQLKPFKKPIKEEDQPAVEAEEVQLSIKTPKSPIESDEETKIEVKIKQKKKKTKAKHADEGERAVLFTLADEEPEVQPHEEVSLMLKKPAKPSVDETPVEISVAIIRPKIEGVEDVAETISLKKKVPEVIDFGEAEISIPLQQKVEKVVEKIVEEDIVVKKKKKSKLKPEETPVEEDVTISLKKDEPVAELSLKIPDEKPINEETAEIKAKRKKPDIVEETSAELEMTKEEPIEVPIVEEQVIEKPVIVQKIIEEHPQEEVAEVKIKKKKLKKLPSTEEAPEEKVTVQLEKPIQPKVESLENVEEEIILKKPTPIVEAEASAELEIINELEIEMPAVEDLVTYEPDITEIEIKEEPQEEIVEEIRIKKKKPKKQPSFDKAEEDEVTVQFGMPLQPKVEQIVNVEEEIKLRKRTPIVEDEASVELEIIKEIEIERPPVEDGSDIIQEIISKQPQEVIVEEVKLKKRNSRKQPSADETPEGEVTIHLGKPIQPRIEPIVDVEEKIELKKPTPIVEDEAAVELEIMKELAIETPVIEELVTHETDIVEKVIDEQPQAEIVDEVKIKKKKPKKLAEEEEVSVQLKKPIKPQVEQIEDISEEIKLKKPTPKVEDEAAAELIIKRPEFIPAEQPEDVSKSILLERPKEETKEQPGEDVAADIKLKKRQKDKVEDEAAAELKILKPSIVSSEEDVITETVSLSKATPVTADQPETHEKITLKNPDEKPTVEISAGVKPEKKKPKQTEEAAADLSITKKVIIDVSKDVPDGVTLSLKQKEIAPQEEYVTEEVIQKPAEKPDEEQVQADVNLKKKKPKSSGKAESEITITKKVSVDEQEETDAQFVLKKPKKKESTEGEFTIKKRDLSLEEISEQIKLKRAEKELTYEEAAATETIRIPEEYESEVEEIPEYEDEIHEFVIKKKAKQQPKQVIDEQAGAYTVKKLKTTRRRSRVDIPEYTDVENVTFRPKSTRTKEDVDQEFKIQLDSYAEEEISMSGKIKLKKKRPFAYSEEADEAHIKIMEEYNDGEGPIIEEIHDDSSERQDTMYDVEEPDEFSDVEDLPLDAYKPEDVEELPADVKFQLKPKVDNILDDQKTEDIEVAFQLKRRPEAPLEDDTPVHVEFQIKPKQKKPQYQVHDHDEEIAVGYIRRRPEDTVTYEEDSITFRKPRKPLPSSYLEGYYSLHSVFFCYHIALIIALPNTIYYF